ncbi:MAG: hypothetical protein WA885_24765, partial [Phormidesmis sp.]
MADFLSRLVARSFTETASPASFDYVWPDIAPQFSDPHPTASVEPDTAANEAFSLPAVMEPTQTQTVAAEPALTEPVIKSVFPTDSVLPARSNSLGLSVQRPIQPEESFSLPLEHPIQLKEPSAHPVPVLSEPDVTPVVSPAIAAITSPTPSSETPSIQSFQPPSEPPRRDNQPPAPSVTPPLVKPEPVKSEPIEPVIRAAQLPLSQPIKSQPIEPPSDPLTSSVDLLRSPPKPQPNLITDGPTPDSPLTTRSTPALVSPAAIPHPIPSTLQPSMLQPQPIQPQSVQPNINALPKPILPGHNLSDPSPAAEPIPSIESPSIRQSRPPFRQPIDTTYPARLATPQT